MNPTAIRICQHTHPPICQLEQMYCSMVYKYLTPAKIRHTGEVDLGLGQRRQS